MEIYKCHYPALIAVIILFATVFSGSIAYGQQSQSLASPTSPRTTRVSAELKAQMCDASNPSLKVVNTTEARICNIPKTVKSVPTTGVATLAPSTSAVSQKPAEKSPKSTSLAVGPAFPSQQTRPQNIVTSRSGDTATTAVSSVNSKSLTALPTIAPQASGINKQQEQIQQLAATSNDTATQNYTFASTTAALPAGKLLFLGYHGNPVGIKSSTSTSSDHGSDSKDKDGTDKKSVSRHSSTRDSDSKDKDGTDKKSVSRHSSTRDSDSKDKDGTDKKKTESKSETKAHEDKNNSDKGKKDSHGSGVSVKRIIKQALKR
jgi:hypothetical protein